MENYKTTWSREEFQAYLLLYCASADFVITEEEREIIKSKLCVENTKQFEKNLIMTMILRVCKKLLIPQKDYKFPKSKRKIFSMK